MLRSTHSGAFARIPELVVAQVVAAVTGWLLLLILTRWLGPIELGAYGLMLAIATALTLPLAWAPSMIVVFGQEERRRYGSISATLGTTGLLVAGVIGAGLLLVGLLRSEASALGRIEGLQMLILVATASVIASVGLGLAQMRSDIRALSISLATRGMAPLTIASGLFLGGVGGTAERALLVFVAGQLVGAIPAYVSARPELSVPRLDRDQMRAGAKYAGGAVTGTLPAYILTNADVLIASQVLSAVGLGGYVLGSRLFQAVLSFVQLPAITILPFLNERRVSEADEDVREFVRRRTGKFIAVAGAVALLAAPASRIAMPALFGPAFEVGATVLAILCAGLPVAAWRALTSPILSSYKLIWHATLSAAAGAFCLLVLGSSLGPAWGHAGLALAVVCGMSVDAFIVHLFVSRRLGTRLAAAGPALVAYFVIATVAIAVVPPVMLLGSVVVGGVSTWIVVHRVRVIDQTDVGNVANVLPQPIRTFTRSAIRRLARSEGSHHRS